MLLFTFFFKQFTMSQEKSLRKDLGLSCALTASQGGKVGCVISLIVTELIV